MAISYEDVLEYKNQLEDAYRDRHEEHRKLRDYWHGRYWEMTDTATNPLTSIFKDLTAKSASVGPDVRLVNNILQQVCVKFQTFLSPLPMIRCYIDPPGTQTRRAQSTLKERYLYGQWSAGQMSRKLTDMSWYLPLMGDCFLGAFPDMKKKLVSPILRSPEYAYPIPSYDGGMSGTIFAWEVPESSVKRAFPNYVLKADRDKGRFDKWPISRRRRIVDPKVTLLEYSDGKEFARWADGVKLNGIEHNFGFNLFEQIKFISVPDEVWSHGAVEQAVNLVEMGNALYSLMFQSVLENVFPTLVLINPSKAPEEIERGPGSVIPINEGGGVEWLHPPVESINAHESFMGFNDQTIKQATSMPDVNFGQFKASIVTGKAINELQGAGTGSVVEMVQGVGIGSGLVAWNEKAIYMGQTMFKDDTIQLFGTETGSIADLNPRRFALTLKGKQLVGSPRNDVVFSPHLSMHEKIVMGLQMAGAGLVSKQWQREQVGIPDSDAMDEEILAEAIQDAVLGSMVQGIQAEPTAENAEEIEKQAAGFLAGRTTPHPLTQMPQGIPAQLGAAPGAQPGGPAPPGATPPAPGPSMSAGARPAAGGQAPTAGAASAGITPTPEASQPTKAGVTTLDQAIGIFQSLTGIIGRVFLVGEIVDTGQTDDVIDVAVTESADRATIMGQLPQLAQRLEIHVIEGEPNEKHVEVTPGKPAGETVEPEFDLSQLGIE